MAMVEIGIGGVEQLLDEYVRNAALCAQGKANKVLQEKLRKKLRYSFANLGDLQVDGSTVWPHFWAEFTTLHHKGLRMAPGRGNAAHMRTLVALKDSVLQELSKSSAKVYGGMVNAPYTVPMSTGRRPKYFAAAAQTPAAQDFRKSRAFKAAVIPTEKDSALQELSKSSAKVYGGTVNAPYTVPMSTGRRPTYFAAAVQAPAAQKFRKSRAVKTAVVPTVIPGFMGGGGDAGLLGTVGVVGSVGVQGYAKYAPLLVAPTFEKRHLTARAPAVVAVGTDFSITARIDVAEGDGPSAPLSEVAIPANGLIVTVEAVIGDKMELRSPMAQQVRVMPGEASPEMEIALRAITLGAADVVLRARTEQSYLGDLKISMMVANQGAPDVRELRSGIEAAPPVPRTATLAITYERASRTYRFMLYGDTTGNHNGKLVLDEDLDVLVPKLMTQANGLARGNAGYSKSAVDRILSGIGNDMWRRFLPDAIRGVLAANWGQIDRLTVLAEDDPLPWELLFAFTPGGPKMGFISDQWLVSRWRYGANPAGGVGGGPTVYVVPASAPQAAFDEIDKLEKIFPSSAIWGTVDELNGGIASPGMGLLHFAAHNTVRYGDPAASFIQLDKPFPQSMLGPQLQGVLERRPLVFINACASAAATVQWQGATSWAARFLDAGAGVFVGSNWEVRDDTALEFAVEFYTLARERQPLGQAFRQARAKSSEPGDPTRFAWTFFGHPDAILQTQEVNDAD